MTPTESQAHARALLGYVKCSNDERRLLRREANQWLRRIAAGELLVVPAERRAPMPLSRLIGGAP